ncbi:MAG: gamma-glutamylcyclotransferase [Pseudomonadota bacterium]
MADMTAQANGQTAPAGLAADGRLWVFAYGSLIWKPEFPFRQDLNAQIHGYHRDFCLHSIEHRGTPERSGLVLGLAPGGACRGVVFEIPAGQVMTALAAMDARELVTSAYVPREVTARTAAGLIRARAYVCDIAHSQFAGRLSVEQATARIVGARGQYGANEDYAFETVRALRNRGIHDGRLEAITASIAQEMRKGA